jgi:hypothetical protein
MDVRILAAKPPLTEDGFRPLRLHFAGSPGADPREHRPGSGPMIHPVTGRPRLRVRSPAQDALYLLVRERAVHGRGFFAGNSHGRAVLATLVQQM